MPPPPFGNAIPQLWLSHIFHLCLNQKNGQNENKRTIDLMPRKINRISLYWFTFICNVWSYVVSATKIALELANCTKFWRYTLLLLCWRVCSRPLCSQPNPNTTTSQRQRKLPSRRCWTRLQCWRCCRGPRKTRSILSMCLWACPLFCISRMP